MRNNFHFQFVNTILETIVFITTTERETIMPNVSQDDVKILLNFFSQKQSVDNYEKILIEMASKYPVEFIDVINKLTPTGGTIDQPFTQLTPQELTQLSHNWCFVESYFLERVMGIWMDFGKGWEFAKEEYIKHNPYSDEYTGEELKGMVCRDIFNMLYAKKHKVEAIKFHRAITNRSLKESKEFIDDYWEKCKHGVVVDRIRF